VATRLAKAFVIMAASSVVVTGLWRSAQSETSSACGVPLQAYGEWQTASLEQVKLDAPTLCSLIEKLDKSPKMNVHAVVVVRDGNLVFETYRKGEDYNWGTKLGETTYTPQMQHDVRSVSRSVVSLLVGIAVDRKLIVGIDEPVFSFFPEYADAKSTEKDGILLRHLLTMTAGLAANENVPYRHQSNTERSMYESAEPYRYVLERKIWSAPGKSWNYNGGATMLLGAVLQKSTGKSLPDLAKEALFDPLGIVDFDWTRVAPSGEPAAGGGLRLRPRDMAKIGQLLLNKGMWHGRRIVSEKWIEASIQPLYKASWNSYHYGYQWWVGESKIGEKTFQWIAAWGLGGQRIFIVPASDLVVAINAGLYASDTQDGVAINILDNFVLAALRD
jgi:CubicO group peptidase (beta-lactamase class C family)